jgi:hypothetical protein
MGAAQRTAPAGGTEDLEMRVDVLRSALPETTPDWIGPSAVGHPALDQLEAAAYVAAFGKEALSKTGLVSITQQVGFSGPATAPLNLVSALLSASGEASPKRTSPPVSQDPDRGTLAAAMGRAGKVGAGSVVVGSSFSYDQVHAAVALRIEA